MLRESIVSQEAEDVDYLRSLFGLDPSFMRYQYSLETLKLSVYNNLTLMYRHWERVNMILMLTLGYKHILDVGCGFGDLSLELSNKGKDVIMLDVDPRRLHVAKHRTKRFGLDAEIVCGDAHQLPFRDNSFEAVFSNQVIEHVTNPVGIVLEKIRVSKWKTIIICVNTSRLPAIGFIYYSLLKRSKPETVPNLGDYDEKYYLNYQVPPINSRIAILLGRIIGALPMLRRVCAGNVVKVYHKRRSS